MPPGKAHNQMQKEYDFPIGCWCQVSCGKSTVDCEENFNRVVVVACCLLLLLVDV